MKKIITGVLLVTASVASAQWTNTSNQFFDSLHMPVSTALLTQRNVIIVKSYPDSGYFLIWEDDRNMATTNTDIYAQKYDKTGNALWAQNGVPVSNGPNAQHFTFSSNQDYRSRSYAATDSAGGFYIGYGDDSISTYYWTRVAVQHMLGNGSAVFPGAGFIVAQTPSGQGYTFSMPLLIADGSKGFFIAYKNSNGNDYIYVSDFRDENGTMNYYGGGRVNDNAIQRNRLAPCGIQWYIDYPGTTVQDYNIWPDGQGGCNVIMSMNGNTGDQYTMLCFNRVWRAKKDATVKTYFRNTTGVACPQLETYKSGNVYMLYTLSKNIVVTECGGGAGPLYVVTSEFLKSNGYQLLDQGAYDYNYPKGVTVSTSGNINVDLVATTRRTLTNNTPSDFIVQGYAYLAEKYDSVPFQRASFNNPDIGYNTATPLGADNLEYFRDTLLAASNYYPDFSLAGGGQEFYAAALMSTTGDRLVRLQHLSVEKTGANSFAVHYKTNKFGTAIGKEVNTGFSGFNISYDFPLVTVTPNGKALFYIREYYRGARISPVINGVELAWGAMGKPISTGVYNGSYYNLEQPFVAVNDLNSAGLISWRDNKNIPGNTSDNIFMRHLDSLNVLNYLPPLKPVRLIPDPYGGTFANPAVLMGTSKKYSTIETYSPYSIPASLTTPVAEILDNYNLGNVGVSTLQNSGTIRKYGNQPYLDRNYTIKVDNDPAGGASINLRLFFTDQEFNTLKTADNSITNPGDLAVIRQSNSTLTAPGVYTPIGGEQFISPVAWRAVTGGYFIEIAATGFGNFFIQKTSAVGLCPGGSAAFSSYITGTNYQWQLNTGGGFANISNNANYSGTNTVNLQLTNIPSSWYGYQYRCVVDGTNSSVFYLRFLNTWTGAVDYTWENPGNWSCGSLPDANTDVIISSGAVGVNSNVSVRSIQVSPGVLFTVNPGNTLTVTH
jgi:hypothetical protein